MSFGRTTMPNWVNYHDYWQRLIEKLGRTIILPTGFQETKYLISFYAI
jgi:hypothetical protein